MKTPTPKDLLEEDGYESVQREADDSWRHGTYITEVFKSESEATFWQASYALSTDGETHGLRDGEAEIIQVYPEEVVTVKYRPVPF